MENSDLNKDAPLPTGESHLSDVTGDAAGGMSDADIMQGYSMLADDPQTVIEVVGGNAFQDDSGENAVGNPCASNGFLTRPKGWER